MSYDWISNSGHFGGGGCCIWLSGPESQDLGRWYPVVMVSVAGSATENAPRTSSDGRTDAWTHTQFVIIYKMCTVHNWDVAALLLIQFNQIWFGEPRIRLGTKIQSNSRIQFASIIPNWFLGIGPWTLV